MMRKRQYDYLIVGSGLFGATFAYMARQSGKSCLVIDSRPHTGGNVYCTEVEGITVHSYGPHVFHTSDKTVWDFVCGFVNFNSFRLCPLANYHGEIFNLPFNMNTFRQMWNSVTPEEANAVIERQRFRGVVTNLEEQALSMVGEDVYRKLISGYTEKQWGRSCCELPPFIIRRLPVRLVYDNSYFDDPYQGVPVDGYNTLVDKLLEGIETRTSVNFFEGLYRCWRDVAHELVYTGKIDDYFHRCLGRLAYRSLRFETQVASIPNSQGVAIMNFTDRETPYTRIIEHKHFVCFGNDVYANPKTVITREYPDCYADGKEAYYPINDGTNNTIYRNYMELAKGERNVIFGGRLAEYAYYDMDKTIASALAAWEKSSVVREYT